MSGSYGFRAVFSDPGDRAAALRAARQLAAACHMRKCAAESESHALIDALVHRHPVTLHVVVATSDELRIPTVLLRGASRSIELHVTQSASLLYSLPNLFLSAQHDQHCRFAVVSLSRVPPRPVAPYVEEFVELARSVGMLRPDPPVTLDPDEVEIPVYGDAFSLLAPELTRRIRDAYFELRAEVDAADGAAVLAELSPTLWGSYTFTAALDDDALFEAVREVTEVAAGAITLCWSDPDDEIWIPFLHPLGGRQDDGRIYTLTLRMTPPGCELVISTILDHCGSENAAAWLSERAGVPIVAA